MIYHSRGGGGGGTELKIDLTFTERIEENRIGPKKQRTMRANKTERITAVLNTCRWANASVCPPIGLRQPFVIFLFFFVNFVSLGSIMFSSLCQVNLLHDFNSAPLPPTRINPK